MKNIFYIIIATIIIFPFSACKTHSQCANEVNVYHFTYDGRNYEIIKELKSWADAAACAVERGGKLVEINDLYEQTAVYNALSVSGISTTYSPVTDGGGTSYVWIGGTDNVTEGTWIWDGTNDGSGTNFWTGQGAAGANNGVAVGGAYVNWGGASTAVYKEPDDYGSAQDAAAMALTGWPSGTTSLGIAGEWNDISMSNAIYFIVEYSSSSINKSNNENNSSFVVSPNPCTNYLSISGTDEIVNLKIFDVKGLLIRDQKKAFVPEAKIKVDSLNAGTYFLLIEGKEHRFYTLNFIKQ
jgi:hypothetical protein